MLTTLPREYLCMILDSGESYFVAVTCNGILFKCVIHKLGKPTCEVYGGSLILSAESSEEVERTDLTPAKRRGTTIVNLEEAVDQNSVTRTPWCDLASRFTNNITVIWRYIKVCTVLQDVFHKCMSSEHHVRGLS
ncbi:hypothetical protein Bca101_073523 [Brassica carinata]